MKIGAVTIGQAPRVDVTVDIMDIFGGKTELIQAGGLDGLTKEDIAEFAPGEGDYVLVSRLKDGGCRLIMMFCTGSFPETLTTKSIPVIYPCEVLDRLVPLMSKKSSIICMTPSPLQIEQTEEKWRHYVKEVKAVAASPYGDWETLEKAADEVKDMDADLIVLDCIGYTQEMKEMFARKTKKMVVLPRTLLARVVSELTDAAE